MERQRLAWHRDAFSGEGSGISCRRPYGFSTGVYYRYRLWRQEDDSGGQWRGAWIMTTPLNFSEYWGEAVGCDTVPVSNTDFTQPAANSLGGGLYEFGSVYSSFSRGSCTGGKVGVADLGWTRAAKTVLGGPR